MAYHHRPCCWGWEPSFSAGAALLHNPPRKRLGASPTAPSAPAAPAGPWRRDSRSLGLTPLIRCRPNRRASHRRCWRPKRMRLLHGSRPPALRSHVVTGSTRLHTPIPQSNRCSSWRPRPSWSGRSGVSWLAVVQRPRRPAGMGSRGLARAARLRSRDAAGLQRPGARCASWH
jgi:hypothetical protein